MKSILSSHYQTSDLGNSYLFLAQMVKFLKKSSRIKITISHLHLNQKQVMYKGKVFGSGRAVGASNWSVHEASHPLNFLEVPSKL